MTDRWHVVLGKDGLNDDAFGEGLTGLWRLFASRIEVVDVEAMDISVLEGGGVELRFWMRFAVVCNGRAFGGSFHHFVRVVVGK